MRIRFLSCPRVASAMLMVAILSLAARASAAPPPSPSARRHVRLVKSEPAANDTIASPRAIRLWFNEKVELKVSTAKLAGTAGTAVALGKLTRNDAVQNAPVVATLSMPLAPGAYRVSWSAASDDGHPSKGTFDFVVKAAPK